MAKSDHDSDYSRAFYELIRDGSYRSAQIVIDTLWSIYQPRSVIDVGCGIGTWLRAFSERGIDDYLGIDGSYVSSDLLEIPADRFVTHDLQQPTDLHLARQFDLAVSLEVGEHLPHAVAPEFVEGLTGLAPVVMFSAAIPGQEGVGHINEQWPSYWSALFADHGYEAYDCLRPALWPMSEVEFWYRQNTLLYTADRSLLRTSVEPGTPISVVAPEHYDYVRAPPRPDSFRQLVRKLPDAARASMSRRSAQRRNARATKTRG